MEIDLTTWNWEMITAFVGVLIGLFALILTIRQMNSSRVHNRLSVMPLVSIHTFSDARVNELTVHMSNEGVGPAIIEAFEIRNKKNSLINPKDHFELGSYIADHLGRNKFETIEATCYKAGEPIYPGKNIKLIHITSKNLSQNEFVELQKQFHDIGFFVRYKSVYNDSNESKHNC